MHATNPQLATPDTDATFYDLLGVRPDASAEDIAQAYARERERYNEATAAQLGAQFVDVVRERHTALDEAYAVLHDPRRRYTYDRELGLVGDETADRRGVSNREVMYAIAGVLIGMLILAGLWSALGRRAPTGPAVTEVSYVAPPIALPTLDGGSFDLTQHRGKVVLVNFWGTWCEPCKQETPALQAAHQQLRDEGLVIVGVDLFNGERDLGRGEADVRAFTEQYSVTYPIALDTDGEVSKAYKLYPIPVSYFIDRDGNVRFIRIGQLTTEDVEALFRRL